MKFRGHHYRKLSKTARGKSEKRVLLESVWSSGKWDLQKRVIDPYFVHIYNSIEGFFFSLGTKNRVVEERT